MKHQKAIIEMLLLAGALPNFSSRIFSYVGPSLSPLVEYLTYCENYDYTLIRLLLQYGARVNFRLPTRLLKIRHPAGVLGQVNTLISQRNYFILRLNWKYDPTNRRCSDIGFRVSYRVVSYSTADRNGCNYMADRYAAHLLHLLILKFDHLTSKPYYVLL